MNVEAEAKRHEADKAASKDLATQKAALLQDKMQFLMLDAMTNMQKKILMKCCEESRRSINCW